MNNTKSTKETEMVDKLGTLIGRDTYLYELAKQSACTHDPRDMVVEGITLSCGTCGKVMESDERDNILGF